MSTWIVGVQGNGLLTLWNGKEKSSLEAETNEVSVVAGRAHRALSLAWLSLTVEVGGSHTGLRGPSRRRREGVGGHPLYRITTCRVVRFTLSSECRAEQTHRVGELCKSSQLTGLFGARCVVNPGGKLRCLEK